MGWFNVKYQGRPNESEPDGRGSALMGPCASAEEAADCVIAMMRSQYGETVQVIGATAVGGGA